jgi:hypothetical protein
MAATNNSLALAELSPIQERIRANEKESIKARWEFGRVLLKQRVDKLLPRGLRAAVKEQYGLEASEITRRIQLAEKFKTEDKLVDACTRCGDSWRRIIREELVKRPGGQSKKETAWRDSKKATLNRWLQEISGCDEHAEELGALLKGALHTRGADTAEVAAA